MANPNPTSNFFIGFGLVLLGHVAQIMLMLFGIPAIILIGVVQLLYVIPLIIWARRRPERAGMVAGILTMAGITFLLNAACFGILYGTFGLMQ